MSIQQRYVLGIACQPGPDPKIRTGMDGGRDWASAEEIEQAAWHFLQVPRSLGINHGELVENAGDFVESYIYRGPDWHTGVLDEDGDEVVVKAGTWLLGAVLTPSAWALKQAGYLTGWSVQGSARRLEAEQ